MTAIVNSFTFHASSPLTRSGPTATITEDRGHRKGTPCCTDSQSPLERSSLRSPSFESARYQSATA